MKDKIERYMKKDAAIEKDNLTFSDAIKLIRSIKDQMVLSEIKTFIGIAISTTKEEMSNIAVAHVIKTIKNNCSESYIANNPKKLKGKMKTDISLITDKEETSLKLLKDQEVWLENPSNLDLYVKGEKVQMYFAGPLDGKWHDELERSEDDSILIKSTDVKEIQEY